MEIRKILNILESGTRFKKRSGLKEQPTSDQIATAALNAPAAQPTSDQIATAALNAPAPAAQPTAQPAAQKTYGGGYDPSKVQYAYGGGKPAAATPTQPASAASSAGLDASKKAAFSGTTQIANNQSSGYNAQSQAQKPATPTPAQPAATQTAAASPSGGAAVAAFGKTAMANAPGGATTPEPAPTATADVSGATKGIPAAFGKMAEDELEEDQDPADARRSKPGLQSGGTATPRQKEKLPSMFDVERANKKEIDGQFTKTPSESPYNKDTKSINPGSKTVNTIADFEENIDYELAEMLRLSGLPIMEKAVSKQQQKFMGMAHAMQKGERVKGASAELKAAAKGMSKKDAKDFASTKHKGLPKKVTEGVVLEAGSTLEHIVNKFKHETKKFINGEDLDSDLYEALFDYYSDNGEIPYGVAKARDGDPYTWIANRFEDELSMMGYPRTHDELNYRGDQDLTELARLAGLTNEDGPGQFGMQKKPAPKSLEMTPTQPGVEPVAQFAADLGMPPLPFFSKKEKADYEAMKARKAERQFQQSGSAYRDDAGVRYNSRGEPKEYLGLRSKDYFDPNPNRDRDLYNMQHDQAAKNIQKESVDLNECGDMGMDTEDKFNVSTNMSSDGTKSVNISAQGDRADDLLQMLKMAGMRPHDDHDHKAMSEPAVVMIGSDDEMMDEELEEAKKRTTRYVNTPDEEYQTVASITRQGNDLNREKKQFAGKPRLGDNPMAESALDVDLDAMLESILIREQDSEIKYDEVEQRVKADFSAPKRRDPSVQELPLSKQEYHGPRSLKSEKTGTEGRGKDKEVDETADLDEQGSNQPNPYPVGQDALTPQQKLNPTNNPNKSIVRGIKDFIMNPLKPGM